MTLNSLSLQCWGICQPHLTSGSCIYVVCTHKPIRCIYRVSLWGPGCPETGSVNQCDLGLRFSCFCLLSFKQLKKKYIHRGSGEKVGTYNVLFFQGTCIQFPAPRLGISPLPVSPAPEYGTLASVAACPYLLYIQTSMCTSLKRTNF